MKTSLEHLPERKQGELSRIVERICELAPKTEMIILFGSYARGDWVEDITVEGHITYEYTSDYDILVIVKEESLSKKNGLWYDVENKAGKLPVKTPLSLIVHDIELVNRRLEKGRFFFTDIKKEGILLYDSGNCQLAEEQELTPKERLGLAKADFKQYFHNAIEFYAGYEFYLERGENSLAAFNLNQATETLYKTALLVYTNYKPKTHKLDKLGKAAGGYDSAFLKIFPMDTDEQKKCFDLLKRAYVDARYQKGFRISTDQLKYLASCVEKLREQTELSCQTKMKTFV